MINSETRGPRARKGDEMKYGLQLSSLSGQIQVGRINKAGTAFLDWEDKTQEFYRATIDMWGGYEQTITCRETGKKWHITMKEINE